VTARHEAQVRQMDRSLREQQDVEFERTMEADRLVFPQTSSFKFFNRKRLEEARLKKESEERKLQEVEEKKELVKRRLTETRERKISARNNLSDEPEHGIRLQFKLPNGAKFIRKFVEDAPISDIFCKRLKLILFYVI
jgi:FAS-associated factor 2